MFITVKQPLISQISQLINQLKCIVLMLTTSTSAVTCSNSCDEVTSLYQPKLMTEYIRCENSLTDNKLYRKFQYGRFCFMTISYNIKGTRKGLYRISGWKSNAAFSKLYLLHINLYYVPTCHTSCR